MFTETDVTIIVQQSDTSIAPWVIASFIALAVLGAAVGMRLLYGRLSERLTEGENTLALFLTLACGFLPGATLIMWLWMTMKYSTAKEN